MPASQFLVSCVGSDENSSVEIEFPQVDKEMSEASELELAEGEEEDCLFCGC